MECISVCFCFLTILGYYWCLDLLKSGLDSLDSHSQDYSKGFSRLDLIIDQYLVILNLAIDQMYLGHFAQFTLTNLNLIPIPHYLGDFYSQLVNQAKRDARTLGQEIPNFRPAFSFLQSPASIAAEFENRQQSGLLNMMAPGGPLGAFNPFRGDMTELRDRKQF